MTSFRAKIKLWEFINEYVTTCGGRPSLDTYGNTRRMAAVNKVEGIFERFAAEADVLSGRSCRENQDQGRGPCGACVPCLHHRIKHLIRSLDYIAQTCVSDPDTAQFACRAAENPPSVFPPEEP